MIRRWGDVAGSEEPAPAPPPPPLLALEDAAAPVAPDSTSLAPSEPLPASTSAAGDAVDDAYELIYEDDTDDEGQDEGGDSGLQVQLEAASSVDAYMSVEHGATADGACHEPTPEESACPTEVPCPIEVPQIAEPLAPASAIGMGHPKEIVVDSGLSKNDVQMKIQRLQELKRLSW